MDFSPNVEAAKIFQNNTLLTDNPLNILHIAQTRKCKNNEIMHAERTLLAQQRTLCSAERTLLTQ